MELVAFQAQPSFQRDGLPYWMFYFLLCIILLLVVFIFLRDKQLRMRISAFLAGARRRSILLRLKFQLKKEKQKRGNLLRQLGEKAWEQDVPVQDSEFIRTELKKLLERKKASQMEWKKAIEELERLHQEEVRVESAEKSPSAEPVEKETQGKAEAEEEVEKYGHRDLEKALRYWAKLKEHIEHRIKNIEAQEEALFYSLGKSLEQRRVGGLGLENLYSEIDIINHRISTLLRRIETLSGG
ncbi:MAG: hypothetical protein ACUVV5_12235 [Candidatus Aminicenantales bacterium]